MNMGNYAHGNQPIQHMLYMYNYSGQPWKAQHWIREVMDKLYTPAPDGYCGDEDNGQTSAWYVFSAMGFYPVCPGTDEYVLGTPYFKEMKLHLENGKAVTISAPNNGDDKRYIHHDAERQRNYQKLPDPSGPDEWAPHFFQDGCQTQSATWYERKRFPLLFL